MSKATRRFIINKLGELVISLLIVTILSFLLVRLSPIDPAEAYARRSMAAFSFTDEQMEALREKMGLNDSLPVQYVKWIRDAFHLDFGKSFVSGQSVFEKVTTAIGITVTMPKVIFPPSRMRENSQRPKLSVPNGYSALLDRYLPRIFVAVGSWGAKNDPNKKNSNITIGIEYERICFVRLIVWPPLSQKHPVAKSAVIYPKGY